MTVESATFDIQASAPRGAVFLSYASQDADAARRICEALRAGGVEVWFDADGGLEHGDEWDTKIRRQIKECVLFIPILSANTQARHEGYFRIEWELAAQRAMGIASGVPFILPVVIDDTREPDALVPDRFRAVQWTRLSGGEVPPAVLQRFLKLWSHRTGVLKHEAAKTVDVGASLDGTRLAPELDGRGQATPLRKEGVLVAAIRRSSRRLGAIAGVIGVLALSLAVWKPWHRGDDLGAPAIVAGSGAQVLIQKAWGQLNQSGRYRTQLEIADDLCRRATAADPDSADAWAAWSQVHTWYVYYAIDQSAQRRESARAAAARAVQLDPKSFEARLAQACYLVRTARNAAAAGVTNDEARSAEPLLRALLTERPNEPRACFALAILLRNLGRDDEAIKFFDAMAATQAFAVEAWTEKAWLLWGRGRFAEAQALDDRALLQQEFSGDLLLRIYLCLTWTGDLDLAKATVESLPPALRQDEKLASFAVRVYWWRREPQAMLRGVDTITEPWITWWSHPKSFYTGQARLLAGDIEAAQVSWQEALRQVEVRARDNPEDASLVLWKAELLGLMGKKAEAESAMRLARSLGTPAGTATFLLVGDWSVALATGHREVALESLEKGYARTDGWPTTWAILRFNPQFDPLRNEPRFQALLARAEADPTRNPHAAAKPAMSDAASAAPNAKSIAVLAFENLSDDKANEYFSDGISEELISALGRVPGLTVKGSTSAFYFKHKEDQFSSADIARQLGVTYLVRGSVRKAGDQVRITAQLTRAATDEVVWSLEPETREVKDVFAVQEEVARLIAQKLQLKLGATVVPKAALNPEAYQLYLQARQAWNLRNAEGYDRAEQLLGESLKLAPDFAPAHAALVDVWITRGQDDRSISRWGVRQSPAVERIVAKGRQAIALDPGSAEAHASLGALWWVAWRFAEAERELREAIRLNPNYASAHQWLGRTFMVEGRLDEALAELKQAAELDPLSPRILDNYSFALLNAQRPTEGLEMADRALRLQPGAEQPLAMKAVALATLGESDAAAATARTLPPEKALHAEIALVIAGKLDSAAALLPSIPENRLEARIAGLVGLGRTSEALAALKPELLASTEADLLLFNPVFDPLRSDPRFREVLKTVGLAEANDRAQAWRAAHPPEKVEAKR